MADGLSVDVNVCDNQKNLPPPYSFVYCKEQLLRDFRNIYAKDIDNILVFHNGHYAQAYRSLLHAMDKIREKFLEMEKGPWNSNIISFTLNNGKRSKTFNIQCMRRVRHCYQFDLPEELMLEVARVKEQQRSLDEEANRRLALNILEKDYFELGQLIECACCYGDCVFDNMAQCSDGHLVCVECLNAFILEIVFGAGEVILRCMMPDCGAEYPQSELKRCLPSKIWNTLEERTLMDNLSMAQIENLVRCPHCGFAAILPPDEKVFTCCRDNCKRVTCRDCGADWTGHEGFPCSVVESRDETSLRKEYEEKMTRAKVRTCLKCRAQFTKESGCNKILCRCGLTMCYICRAPRIAYNHFCLHTVVAGKRCRYCKACPLWTNSKQDEDRAIEEIRREARAKRKALGFKGDKDFGAPVKVKRARL